MEYKEVGKGKDKESTSKIDEANERVGEVGREEEELMELQIITNKLVEGHKLGIGIVAKQMGGRTRVEWALMDRSSQTDIQDEAVAVRLALMKARQLSWQRIKVINANKQLIALLKVGKGDNPNTGTLVEDIHALANLFQMCFFEARNTSNMTLCNHLSHYALSIFMDEEGIFDSS